MPAAPDVVTAVNPDPVGFGVYVHWPFCAAKCPYCDFNSHVRFGGVDQAAWTMAFASEIARAADETGPRDVTSIFLGGGTPSLMAAGTVAAILQSIGRHWRIAEGCEITLEANPTSVEAQRFQGYRAAGVNRVSLGVQALRDADLKALGRLHSAEEALRALAVALDTFDRVSFDLIYARSNQTPAHWRAELREALAYAAGHLSLYQLTIEPDTPFAALHAAGRLVVPEPDLADALYEITREETEAAGLPLYEISNHARPGEESRHNLLYWRYGEYVGVGPGAHGRPIICGKRHATSTERVPETWLAHAHNGSETRTERTPLSRDECADELLLMGLRLREGVDLGRLRTVGGVMLPDAAAADLMTAGFIEVVPDAPHRLRATAAGRFVLNRLVLELSGRLVPAA